MLRHSNIHANPVIVKAVEKLFDEDRQFERAERRISFREAISRPCRIRLSGKDEIINGFTKNISFEGVGVITHESFQGDEEAKIEIHSSHDTNPVIFSRLAWCKPFGDGWYVSGWRFVTAVRD